MARTPCEIQNSFDTGVFEPGRSVQYDCSTSNYTYPRKYLTVDFRSNCKDVRKALLFSSELDTKNPTLWTITIRRFMSLPPKRCPLYSMGFWIKEVGNAQQVHRYWVYKLQYE